MREEEKEEEEEEEEEEEDEEEVAERVVEGDFLWDASLLPLFSFFLRK